MVKKKRKRKKRPEDITVRGLKEMAGGATIVSVSPAVAQVTGRPEAIIPIAGLGLLLTGKGARDIVKGLEAEGKPTKRRAKKEFA